MSEPRCPRCGNELTAIKYPPDSLLNRDQWESQLPGDLYCTCHNNHLGNKPYAYFWRSELVEVAPSRSPAEPECNCGSHKLAPLYHRPDCFAANEMQKSGAGTAGPGEREALPDLYDRFEKILAHTIDTNEPSMIIAALVAEARAAVPQAPQSAMEMAAICEPREIQLARRIVAESEILYKKALEDHMKLCTRPLQIVMPAAAVPQAPATPQVLDALQLALVSIQEAKRKFAATDDTMWCDAEEVVIAVISEARAAAVPAPGREIELWKALYNLRCEVAGWLGMARVALVQELSLTNVRVMEARMNEADIALGADSGATSKEG